VNRVIDKSLVKKDAPEFVLNRIAMQEKYLAEINSSFPNVRGILPEMDKEIRGVALLREAMKYIF
ncbi:MAG: hypothetical protein OEW70_04995, partial [candidate division WOR-3 bacterium]|nr:hypothetical protein [candidate division WOR-3 bacterium]